MGLGVVSPEVLAGVSHLSALSAFRVSSGQRQSLLVPLPTCLLFFS